MLLDGGVCVSYSEENDPYTLQTLAVTNIKTLLDNNQDIDPIANEWEVQALCALGQSSADLDEGVKCPKHDIELFPTSLGHSR